MASVDLSAIKLSFEELAERLATLIELYAAHPAAGEDVERLQRAHSKALEAIEMLRALLP